MNRDEAIELLNHWRAAVTLQELVEEMNIDSHLPDSISTLCEKLGSQLQSAADDALEQILVYMEDDPEAEDLEDVIATGESPTPTPYAIICPGDGRVFLTAAEYRRQLNLPDSQWRCPRCGAISQWDDDNSEQALL